MREVELYAKEYNNGWLIVKNSESERSKNGWSRWAGYVGCDSHSVGRKQDFSDGTIIEMTWFTYEYEWQSWLEEVLLEKRTTKEKYGR